MRGKIYNRDRAKQLIDFSGLIYGNITPTDIDGLIEYHNKGYVLMDTKYQDAICPHGQRLALERTTDDLTKSGKPTLCIISEHEVDDPNEDIDMANTIVREFRWKGKWQKPKATRTTKMLVDWFISLPALKGY